MEDDLLVAVGGWHSEDAADVLQDHETERHIFPEETRLKVEGDLGGICGVLGHHGEGHATVAEVRVEDALEAGRVGDLALVHGANSLGNRQNLG